LRMVAGRHGDDAALLLGRLQQRQAVEGPALLEGGGELLVFELEPDLAAEDVRQRSAPVAVGLDNGTRQPSPRGLDVLELDSYPCGGTCRGPRGCRLACSHDLASCNRPSKSMRPAFPCRDHCQREGLSGSPPSTRLPRPQGDQGAEGRRWPRRS